MWETLLKIASNKIVNLNKQTNKTLIPCILPQSCNFCCSAAPAHNFESMAPSGEIKSIYSSIHGRFVCQRLGIFYTVFISFHLYREKEEKILFQLYFNYIGRKAKTSEYVFGCIYILNFTQSDVSMMLLLQPSLI